MSQEYADGSSGADGKGRRDVAQGEELTNAMMWPTELRQKFEQIHPYIVPEDGWFIIDKRSASNELTDTEIQVIDQALHHYQTHHLKQDDVSIQSVTQTIAVFLGAVAVFVGGELATEVTKSFYHWGMTEACQKWGHIGIIGRFCRANDYV
ncbi:hypothetical protein KFZ58_14935 [Virgibacillus sp. NKC19-16]|uniref:hypothetical protein n=1 Tax=Virgibacillus salidurans TaxID=2831673 RepID=UPI001F3BD64D|nr:hypothetical protein [Virgibacillus sp. NKC19-16]UJL45674.1 hypothetical protein KFZ58_14935 [Virgibacillus sp. NKC19-16]